MSDKCSHNNHSHFFLWFFVWCLSLNSCLDCSGDQTRTKNRIGNLEAQYQQLQNSNSNLQSRVEVLENQLSKSEIDKGKLKEQLEQLRNIKKEFYGK